MAAEYSNLHSADLFAARDVNYLRQTQYGTLDKLNARILLHTKYASSSIDWFSWLRAQIAWSTLNDALEVGCGTGMFWSTLSTTVNEGLRLVLTDLSSAMVKSSLTHAQRHFSNATGLVANVQNLPFEASSFDLVIANQMLYHALSPKSAITEMCRVLRPGGILLASTIGPDHLNELFEIEAAVFGGDPRRSHADVFGSINGGEMLETEFTDVEWRPFDDELRCTNADDVMAYMTSTPPGEDATPEQLVQLRAEIDNRLRNGKGILRVTKDTGAFVARRTDRNGLTARDLA